MHSGSFPVFQGLSMNAKAVRAGRRHGQRTQRLSKNRTFRILPSLDRALVKVAKQSGRSVSEIIENYLVRALDTAALMRLLQDDGGPNAVHLLGLIGRALILGQVADWASDEKQRGVLKTAVSVWIDAIARGELTMEQVIANRPRSELTDTQMDILREGELLAFTLFNPHELWARPAEPHLRAV